MRWLRVVLVVSVSGGCVLGPNYERSENAIAERPTAKAAFGSANDAAFTSAELPDHWWTLYDDQVLDALVVEALAHNTDLRVTAARIAHAESELDAIADAKSITTKLDAAVMYAKLSQQEHMAVAVPGGYPNFWIGSLNATVSYQLDFLGQVERAVEAATADVLATRAAYDSARITVAAETARAYVEACATGHDIAVTEHLIALQHDSSEMLRRLVDGGRAIASDVERSLALEAQLRASLPPQQARRQVALFELAVLAGRPPIELPVSVVHCEEEPLLRQPVPVGDGAALLRRRPDVRRAEAKLHAATARIGVAKADMWPHIILGASVGSTGLIKDLFTDVSNKFSIFPGVSWSFPNRKVARARIAGAEAEVDELQAELDGVVLRALLETERALTNYAHDIERVHALEDAREHARSARDGVAGIYGRGRLTAIDLLDAERSVAAIEQQVVLAESAMAQDQIAVFLALGGGWSQHP